MSTQTPHVSTLGFTTEAISRRAEACAAIGDHRGAAREYRILADLNPQDVGLGTKLAQHLVAAGRYRDATDEHLRLAGVLAASGETARAVTVAQRALRLDASRATPRRLMPLIRGLGAGAQAVCEEAARMHIIAGRRSMAAEIHGLLVKSDPASLVKRLRYAELALAEGNVEEGLAALRMVAKGLRAQGRTQEFVRVAEMIMAHGGRDAWSLRELANHYQHSGEPAKAVRKLHALLRLEPGDLFALERLVWVNAALGEPAKARAYLVRLIKAMAETHDRAELRAVFTRAEAWSRDESYQREIEVLRVTTLCQGAVPRRAKHSVTRKVGSAKTPPPPPGTGVVMAEILDYTNEVVEVHVPRGPMTPQCSSVSP